MHTARGLGTSAPAPDQTFSPQLLTGASKPDFREHLPTSVQRGHIPSPLPLYSGNELGHVDGLPAVQLSSHFSNTPHTHVTALPWVPHTAPTAGVSQTGLNPAPSPTNDHRSNYQTALDHINTVMIYILRPSKSRDAHFFAATGLILDSFRLLCGLRNLVLRMTIGGSNYNTIKPSYSYHTYVRFSKHMLAARCCLYSKTQE